MFEYDCSLLFLLFVFGCANLTIDGGSWSQWNDTIDGNSPLWRGHEYGVFSHLQYGHISFLPVCMFKYQFFKHSVWKMWLHSLVIHISDLGVKSSRHITQLLWLNLALLYWNWWEIMFLSVSFMYFKYHSWYLFSIVCDWVLFSTSWAHKINNNKYCC